MLTTALHYSGLADCPLHESKRLADKRARGPWPLAKAFARALAGDPNPMEHLTKFDRVTTDKVAFDNMVKYVRKAAAIDGYNWPLFDSTCIREEGVITVTSRRGSEYTFHLDKPSYYEMAYTTLDGFVLDRANKTYPIRVAKLGDHGEAAHYIRTLDDLLLTPFPNPKSAVCRYCSYKPDCPAYNLTGDFK